MCRGQFWVKVIQCLILNLNSVKVGFYSHIIIITIKSASWNLELDLNSQHSLRLTKPIFPAIITLFKKNKYVFFTFCS